MDLTVDYCCSYGQQQRLREAVTKSLIKMQIAAALNQDEEEVSTLI